MLQKDKYLYKYPPDIKLSQRHRLASRIFKKYSNKTPPADCECCQKRIGEEQSQTKSIFFDPLELSFLGPGLPLYFGFLKNSIFLLFSFLIFYSSFCLYSNKISNYCITNDGCDNNFIDTFSILNKQNSIKSLQTQLAFMLFFTILSFFILQFLRNQLKKTNQKCDLLIDSPSDYAILIRRLPNNVTQEQIRQLFSNARRNLNQKQQQETLNLKINHIVMSFCMASYRETKQKNIENFKKSINDNTYQTFQPLQFRRFDQAGDVCIVIFQKQQSKDLFKYQPTFYQKILKCLWSPCVPLGNFQVRDEKVCIERAPQPDDIIWENANVQIDEAIKRKTKFNLLSICLLLAGCGIQIPLAMAQQKVSSTAQTALGVVCSLIISLTNFGILQFLRYSSSNQKNLTHTQYNSVLMVKISFLQFLNAGVFLLISKFLASPSTFSFSNSLVFQINTVMVLNGISHTVCVFILDHFQIINKIYLYLGQKGHFKFTQAQRNQLYQRPVPDMPYKYGYILKTLWLTAFYTSFVPVCTIYSLIGLTINYLVQKKLFCSSYSAPQMISSALNLSALKLIQFFPLCISFGGLVIFIYFSNQVSGLCFVYFMCSLIISIAIVIIPMENIAQRLFKQEEQTQLISSNYSQIESNFEMTYEMTNPAYVSKKKRKKVDKKKKKFRIGDDKQIQLDINQITNNTYQGIIQRALVEVEQQKSKNRQIGIRIDRQRDENEKQQKDLYETIARKAIIQADQNQPILLKNPRQIKRKIRQLQVYNPITANQPKHQFKYSDSHYKNFIQDKSRVKSLIGNPFSRRIQLKNNILSSAELQKLQEAI